MKKLGGNYYLSKTRQQGSGLHIYFTTEMIKNPNFPLEENDEIVVTVSRKKKMLVIKKVDWKNLMR